MKHDQKTTPQIGKLKHVFKAAAKLVLDSIPSDA